MNNTITMVTSKSGVSHGALAVRSCEAAARTFKHLREDGIVDQAAVYVQGYAEPVMRFGNGTANVFGV